jgi:hypothetical protein
MSFPTSGRSSARVTNDDRLALATTAAGRDFADGSSGTSSSTSTRARYVTARRLAALDRGMSDRDRAVLTTLARVRIATARQLYHLHFEGVTRRQARASLASLAGRRVITRLPRVVGGASAGSTGYVYVLDIAGQRLARPNHTRPQRPWSVGSAFLDHSLAVTELYIQLVEAERAGRLRLEDFATEPACWRYFHGPGGARLVLKPDAVLRLVLGRYEDRWWIEVDRGTESRTALAHKCDLYRQYWQSGGEQSRGGGVFPRVLWLVPDEDRQSAMTGVIGRQPAYAWPLFAVAQSTDAVARLLRGAGE